MMAVCPKFAVFWLVRRLKDDKLAFDGLFGNGVIYENLVLKEGLLDDIWIQPTSKDTKNAFGCALASCYLEFKSVRKVKPICHIKQSEISLKICKIEILHLSSERLERQSCGLLRLAFASLAQ